MKHCLPLLSLLLTITAAGQQNLSGSPVTSAYTYIYRLTNEAALKLHQKGLGKKPEDYLHHKIDSFRTGSQPPHLPHGHYLLVKAQHNRLAYEQRIVPMVQIKILNNQHDLAVLVHNSAGQTLTDATLQIGNKRLLYDAATTTYRLNKSHKAGLLEVRYAGMLHLFTVVNNTRKHFSIRRLAQRPPLKYAVSLFKKDNRYRHYDFFRNRTRYEQKHSGFMVFNKPMYKPGDTVRLKAFVTTKKGRPVGRPLLLRLSDAYFTVDTIIATVQPYRKGGYTYEAVLNDALDLDLDDEYLLTLEEKRSRKFDVHKYDGDGDEDEYAAKRKVLMRGTFNYEEYELGQITFAARSDAEEHHRGQQPVVYVKATDENGLPVLDGRVELTAIVSDYDRKMFGAPQVFLPDTLWRHTQALEAAGETTITLPDSLFPAASFNYTINCAFLNSNNERQTETLYQKFHYGTDAVVFNMIGDSLSIALQVSGRDKPAEALVLALGKEGDTLLHQQIRLPGAVSLHPFAEQYKVATDAVADSFFVEQESRAVWCTAYRTKDSIQVQLHNAHRLPVWYTLFAGGKAVLRGSGATWEYRGKTTTPKDYFISLQYILSGEIYKENFTVAYQDKLLNVEVLQPAVVYPGQTTDIEIKVTDKASRPVPDADVTAYAFTKKFTDAMPPRVPYFGKLYGAQKVKFNPSLEGRQPLTHLQILPWQRWSRELGLDSIEYFRFLHPETVYANWEPAPDSLTQIAPFVVQGGELLPVHHLYIDEQPHFFSQTGHLQRYSFAVSPGRHALRLRTPNSIIWLDSIWAQAGAKTVIAINADTANKRIRMAPMPDTLTMREQQLWNHYLILMENKYGEKPAYVEQSGRLFPLNLSKQSRERTDGRLLVGPLLPQHADLVVKDRFTQSFEVEGGFEYRIEKGLVRQKWTGKKLYPKWLSKEPQLLSFKDYVLTKKELDTLWQQYLDNRNATTDLFYNNRLSREGAGQLQISFNDSSGTKPFIKAVILFRNDEPHFIRIYKGQERDLGYLQPNSSYRLMALLRNDAYYLKEGIIIKPSGINYYEVDASALKPGDSTSRRIAAIINNRESGQGGSADADDINKTFNFRYLDTSIFMHRIEGRVLDKNGNPVPFATITIKNTVVSTTANAEGYYSLPGPEQATVVISALGFAPVEEYALGNLLTTVLYTANQSLQEVVVVGFGIQRKQELTGSVSVVQSGEMYITGTLAGKAPGIQIQIRGANSITDNAAPLIIIDGVPFSGNLDNLDPSQLLSVNVLKSDEATKLYGAMAAGGTVIITTKKALEAAGLSTEVAPQYALRKAFRDHAYWQPMLKTGRDGRAVFTTTFPDDVTAWRSFAIAMADGRRTGFAEGSVSAFKAMTGTLSLPPFLVWGDSATVIGKTQNYMRDSLQVQRSFLINDSLVS